MSEKRRDNKNCILRIGEQQRADGRYLFSTLDPISKKRFQKKEYLYTAGNWKDMIKCQREKSQTYRLEKRKNC